VRAKKLLLAWDSNRATEMDWDWETETATDWDWETETATDWDWETETVTDWDWETETVTDWDWETEMDWDQDLTLEKAKVLRLLTGLGLYSSSNCFPRSLLSQIGQREQYWNLLSELWRK
jgi:hypothetical protein